MAMEDEKRRTKRLEFGHWSFVLRPRGDAMMLFPRYDGAALIEQICGVENLTLAWRRVRSNIQIARRGRSAGPDAITVRDFEADWTRQMTHLAEELRAG